MKDKIEKKIDLLLRCWLSDRDDDLSDEAIDKEKELMKEVSDVLLGDKE